MWIVSEDQPSHVLLCCICKVMSDTPLYQFWVDFQVANVIEILDAKQKYNIRHIMKSDIKRAFDHLTVYKVFYLRDLRMIV